MPILKLTDYTIYNMKHTVEKYSYKIKLSKYIIKTQVRQLNDQLKHKNEQLRQHCETHKCTSLNQDPTPEQNPDSSLL